MGHELVMLAGLISSPVAIAPAKANCGETRVDVIARHCAELAAADVSTSTYGLGENFNEDLMAEMAKSGQGQAHYGRTAEDLIDPFQQEFDLLSALIARKLRLGLSPEPGVTVPPCRTGRRCFYRAAQGISAASR